MLTTFFLFSRFHIHLYATSAPKIKYNAYGINLCLLQQNKQTIAVLKRCAGNGKSQVLKSPDCIEYFGQTKPTGQCTKYQQR